jgi:hypothetical protein
MRHFSRMSALFEARATKERALVHAIAKLSIELIAIYFHCFEIFILLSSQIMYFQNSQKGEYFLDYFEALVRKIDVRSLVLQNNPKSIGSSA